MFGIIFRFPESDYPHVWQAHPNVYPKWADANALVINLRWSDPSREYRIVMMFAEKMSDRSSRQGFTP